MANHSISIALCTYNGAAYIAEQLDSILGQTLPPDEIVIVDDGSTDDTPGIVREYAEKYGNIHFFENEDRLGFVRNFSRAISLTKGDYVALSDQDDGRQKKWGGVLRIKNRHYRNIYSSKFPKYILLRSLFTLLPF